MPKRVLDCLMLEKDVGAVMKKHLSTTGDDYPDVDPFVVDLPLDPAPLPDTYNSRTSEQRHRRHER